MNALPSDVTDSKSIGRDLTAPAAAGAQVKDLAATSLADFDLNVVEGDGRTRSDVEAHYAAGLQLVSAAQGLPAGQLDFTRMSDRQLRILASHMLVSGTADVDTLEALGSSLQSADAQRGSTAVYSDEPVNRFAWLRARIDYDITHDSPAAASFEKRALSLIRNMHESTDVSISYAAPSERGDPERPARGRDDEAEGSAGRVQEGGVADACAAGASRRAQVQEGDRGRPQGHETRAAQGA